MSVLTQAPTESTCPDCGEDVTGLALKCSTPGSGRTGCGKYVHLKCSQLPSHYIVRFDVSRASYLCKACVQVEAGDQYEDSLRKIEDILRAANPASPVNNAEETGGGEVVSETENSRINNDGTSAGQNGGGEVVSETQNSQDDSTRSSANGRSPQAGKKKVCKDYLKKNCKHGKSGKVGGLCRFGHPKMCYKFLKYGSRNSNGCNGGTNCKLGYHPPLCWQFSKRGDCRRENCGFYHQKHWGIQSGGRSRQQEEADGGRRSQPPRNHSSPQRSYAEAAGRTNTAPTHMNRENREDPFLALHNQMQTQIQQMQGLMQMVLQREERMGGAPLARCQCGKA